MPERFRPALNPPYVAPAIINAIWRSVTRYYVTGIEFYWNGRYYRFRYTPDIYYQVWLRRAGQRWQRDLEAYVLSQRPGTLTVAELEHDLYGPD